MKVLFICHRFPFPPKRGGKIRPFNIIRHLTDAGHKVTVCSLVRSEDEAGEGKGIAPYCERFAMAQVDDPVQIFRMVTRLPLRSPSTMGFFYSRDLDVKVHAALRAENWDLIFVHCSSVAPYVTEVRGIPKILDFGDMDSQKWLEYARYKAFPLSLGYQLEGAKMLAAEKRLASCFDLCTATTQAEWNTLEDYGTGVIADWFPNGVDSDFFCPVEESHEPETVSFIGRMDYYPNQEAMIRFCRDTWPLLKRRRPGLKLLIVGAEPSAAVRRLGEISGVSVAGSVPDVRPYVRRSALMVAPLAIARGTQNKILEAMAMGVPVVTSSIAAQGVDAEAEDHFLVADSPQGYSEAILRIIDEPAERARLARAGRERMLSHHAWPKSMKRLDAIIQRCIMQFDNQQRPFS